MITFNKFKEEFSHVNTFLHAQDVVVKPQLITMAKIKDMMRKESLPDGLDFPSFPSLELSKLITPIIFISKFLSCTYSSNALATIYPYQLYKLQPFPVEQQEKVFVYFEVTKKFIFTDAEA